MKPDLAMQILVEIMEWDVSIATEEINKIRYLTAVKYDNYRNFGVGKRFLESLVLWLCQLKTMVERKAAYQFIMNRLLYISETQMDHLVDLTYPQRVFPILSEQTMDVERLRFSPYQVKKIRTSDTFRQLKRKTLFLGMSDGAKMDTFRRKHHINNEQISISYELSKDKWKRMYDDLQDWLKTNKYKTGGFFENIFLVDDFSGSGNSILKKENDRFKGKLTRFVRGYLGSREKPGILGQYCRKDGPKLFIQTYVATQKAINHLKKTVKEFESSPEHPNFASCRILEPLQLIEDKEKVPQKNNEIDGAFEKILDSYYDARIEDYHTWTGGTDLKYGYAGCALPLVLCHNCPNNSVYLLWAESEETKTHPGLKALFPRISRHLEER